MPDLTTLAALEVALDEGVAPHLERLRAAREEGLARALAIDLALLREHPEALMGCLLSRLSGERLEVWCAEQRKLHLGRPWVRPLRSAPNALGGPLRAELRRFAEPVLEGITADDEVLIAAEGAHWRWNPRTAEVSRWDPLNPAPPRYAVEWHRGSDVRLVDQQTGRDVLLVTSPEDLSSWRLSLDERWVAVVTKDEDWHESLTVFEVTGREVFRAAASRVGFSQNGRWMIRAERSVFVSRPDGSEAVKIAEGGGFLCVSDDGKWAATTRPGVIQWFAVDAAIVPDPLPPRALPLAFSLDGSRLTAGQELRDGVTGTKIARLDFQQGEYLEGGPPSNWFQLGSEAIVVCEALAGMRAWDTKTGAEIFRDPQARYAQWNQLGFSPEGRHYAVTIHADNAASIFALDRAPPVRLKLALEKTGCLALGPGGAFIAQGDANGVIALHSAEGPLIGLFPLHRAEVWKIAFLGGGRIFSIDVKGEALVWRAADGSVLARRIDHRSVGVWDANTWDQPPSKAARWTLVRDRSLTRFIRGDAQLIYPSSQDFIRHPTEPIFANAEAIVRIEEG